MATTDNSQRVWLMTKDAAAPCALVASASPRRPIRGLSRRKPRVHVP